MSLMWRERYCALVLLQSVMPMAPILEDFRAQVECFNISGFIEVLLVIWAVVVVMEDTFFSLNTTGSLCVLSVSKAKVRSQDFYCNQ